MKTAIGRVCKEPYRLFFPLGIILGGVGIGHWLAYFLGWIQNYSGFFHSSLQMQAYMSSFVIGFLLTAMPRFANAPHATRLEISVFLLLILGVWGFLSRGEWIFSQICFLSILMALGLFAFRRFRQKKSVSRPPLEFVWIPIALLHGMIGTLLMTAVQLTLITPAFIKVAKPMMDQGFILSVVIGVGGFLGPRLMGLFQPLIAVQGAVSSEILRIRKKTVRFHLAMGFLFFLSFWAEGLDLRFFAYALRAVVVTVTLLRSRAWPRWPRASDFYVWLLWASFWFVVAGSWAIVLFPKYRIEMLHLIFIGGFSLMTFSVATMVAMSHAGEPDRLRRPMWILWLVAFGIGIAVVLRAAAPFYLAVYFRILAFSSFCWLVVGVSWLCFIFPKFLKVPHEDEFEKFHEAAKKNMEEKRNTKPC
jgi:uncharacterized protein involved in response to NO